MSELISVDYQLPAWTATPRQDNAALINRVVCCDALDLLRTLATGSVNAIVTDPPYGLAAYKPTEIKRLTRYGDGGEYNRVNETWDLHVPLDWMNEVKRVLKPGGAVIVFSGKIGLIEIGYRALQLDWLLNNEITWFKPNATPNFSGRMVTAATEKFYWYVPHGKKWTYNRLYAKSQNNGNNFRDIWTFYPPIGESRQHPTQKPIELMDRIVRLFTNPGDLIVDPFAGSGTTLVAAKNAGRDYLGSDLEPRYVKIARQRLESAENMPLFVTTQQGLFGGESKAPVAAGESQAVQHG